MYVLMLSKFFSFQGKVVLELSHYLEEPTGSAFSAKFTLVFRGHNSNCFNKPTGSAEQIIRSRHQVTKLNKTDTQLAPLCGKHR